MHRSIDGLLEIFDPLGCDLPFVQRFLKINAIYIYNNTPVQCSGSRICGAFVLYFIIYRYYNLDQGYADFVNNYFEKDCRRNERQVNEFLKTFSKIV